MKELVQNAGSGKKYLHRLQHENHTTANFGFVQPLMVNERAARDNVSLRCGQSVFLNPMSKPTFGRVVCKTYESFVPIVDIWHPYESFLAAQSYHGADSDYIPSIVPNVSQKFLTALLMHACKVRVYQAILDTDQDSNYIGYHQLSVISDTDAKLQAEEDFSQFLTDFVSAQGVDFLDSVTQSHLIPPLFTFPTQLPYQSYEESDFVAVYESNNNSYVFFCDLTQEGRNIRKIIIGCGLQANNQSENVSLLPLFAYFKAYFDLFNPMRDRTWKETYAFKFMEWVEQKNDAEFSEWARTYTGLYSFLDFFKNLAYCYYTQNPDYVSAHISGATLNIASQGLDSYPALNEQGNLTIPVAITQLGNQPATAATSSGTSRLTQNRLDILKVLYHRYNSGTALGGDVQAFLKAFYGNTLFDEPEANYIGSQRVNVDISMVVNQAQTGDGDLGEYAAKGLADDGGTNFNFTCRTQGYVVVLSCFVPESRYAQGVDPQSFHLKRYDFFTPDLDSKTLLPTRKGVVHGAQEFISTTGDTVDDLSSGFGNIPNYFEYKVKQNILNGDMSLASKRASYLPFTLDKLMPWRIHSSGNGIVRIQNFDSSLLVASSKWRYIGLDAWLGWFNRIFINSGNDTGDYNYEGEHRGFEYLEDIDDNFILYTFLDYNVSSLALPTQSSFQTVDEGDDTFAVEKA